MICSIKWFLAFRTIVLLSSTEGENMSRHCFRLIFLSVMGEESVFFVWQRWIESSDLSLHRLIKTVDSWLIICCDFHFRIDNARTLIWFINYCHFSMLCYAELSIENNQAQYQYQKLPRSQPELLFHEILHLKEPLVDSLGKASKKLVKFRKIS